MARSLDQILTELNAVYQPQKDQYSSAITAVDPAQQAEEQGLNTAKTDAFSQIETAANRRGVFYGGMPIAEEQRYTGAQFLPSVANLRSKYAQQKFDLTNALNKVTSDEYNNANSIHQTELDREEKQREFDAQLAAQEAASKTGGVGWAPASVCLASAASADRLPVAAAAPMLHTLRNLAAALPSPAPTANPSRRLLTRNLPAYLSGHCCKAWLTPVTPVLKRRLVSSAMTTVITRICSVATPAPTTP
jgi:hypothetical protein